MKFRDRLLSRLPQAGLALLLTACGGSLLQKPPASLQLPYQETFEQPSENWDVYDDGIVSYQFANGQLVVTVDDVNGSAWSTFHYSLDDFVLEVDTIKLAGPDDNGFGVLFRYQDPENFYRFDISSDGYYTLSKRVNGTEEEISPWKTSEAILQAEQTNRLRVTAQGNTFSFHVNGTPVNLCVGPGAIWDPQSPDTCLGGEVLSSWTDGTFSKGQIALGITAFMEPGPSIGFDNLTIQEPGAAP